MVRGHRLTYLVESCGSSFLWVKIQLYSYALHEGMIPSSAKSEFIVRGFEACFHFLNSFSSVISNISVFMLPALYNFGAVCSWMFILKALYSQYRIYVNVDATEKILVDAQAIIASKGQ